MTTDEKLKAIIEYMWNNLNYETFAEIMENAVYDVTNDQDEINSKYESLPAEFRAYKEMENEINS